MLRAIDPHSRLLGPLSRLLSILFVLGAIHIFLDSSIFDDAPHSVPKETSASASVAQHHNNEKQNQQAQIARQCFRPKMDLSSIPSDGHRPLPKPYLNLGFPKAGSTSLHAFFTCGGIRSSHQFVRKMGYCGTCIQTAIRQGLQPPLQTCGHYVSTKHTLSWIPPPPVIRDAIGRRSMLWRRCTTRRQMPH